VARRREEAGGGERGIRVNELAAADGGPLERLQPGSVMTRDVYLAIGWASIRARSRPSRN